MCECTAVVLCIQYICSAAMVVVVGRGVVLRKQHDDNNYVRVPANNVAKKSWRVREAIFFFFLIKKFKVQMSSPARILELQPTYFSENNFPLMVPFSKLLRVFIRTSVD